MLWPQKILANDLFWESADWFLHHRNVGFNRLTRHLKLSYYVAINIFLNQSKYSLDISSCWKMKVVNIHGWCKFNYSLQKAPPSFLAKLLLYEKCHAYTRPNFRMGGMIVQYLRIYFLTLQSLIKHNYYITNETISNVLFSRTVAFLDCSSSEALQESNNSSSSDLIISTKKTPKQHNSIHSYSKLACLKKLGNSEKNPSKAKHYQD